MAFMSRLMALPLTALVACAHAPEDAAGPGPMRPLPPDHALDEAAPLGIDDPTLEAWLSERVAHARANTRERVRLPVVRRVDGFGCDCPTYAIAPSPSEGPFYWLALVDQTSAGIAPGAWMGWVDGRFTGELRTYHSSDDGGLDITTPVFEVYRQRRRGDDDVPEVRVVRDTQ